MHSFQVFEATLGSDHVCHLATFLISCKCLFFNRRLNASFRWSSRITVSHALKDPWNTEKMDRHEWRKFPDYARRKRQTGSPCKTYVILTNLTFEVHASSEKKRHKNEKRNETKNTTVSRSSAKNKLQEKKNLKRSFELSCLCLYPFPLLLYHFL